MIAIRYPRESAGAKGIFPIFFFSIRFLYANVNMRIVCMKEAIMIPTRTVEYPVHQPNVEKAMSRRTSPDPKLPFVIRASAKVIVVIDIIEVIKDAKLALFGSPDIKLEM